MVSLSFGPPSSIPLAATEYRVQLGGTPIEKRLAPILVELQVTKKAGQVSDAARIVLDDTGGQVVMPPAGEALIITINGAEVFSGVTDTPRSSGSRGQGRLLSIPGKGVDPRGKAKSPHQKHWDNETLKAVLTEAGKLAEISDVRVHADLASITRPFWAMDGESFPAFGLRIARELGATFKILDNKTAVLVPRSAGQGVSGQALTSVSAAWGQNIITWDIGPSLGRPQHREIAARYYDFNEARWKTEKDTADGAGSAGDQAMTFAADDADTAKRATKSERAEADRKKGVGSVEIDGDATVEPEAPCTLSGLRDGIDGTYTIDGVRLTLSRNRGFLDALDLANPQGGAGSDSRT